MFLPQGVPKSQMAVRDCRRAMIRLQLKTRSKIRDRDSVARDDRFDWEII